MNKIDQAKYYQIYTKLKNDIINNNLKPNFPLVESDLCQQFGASRTPIRQSLQQLERDGFVEYIPNKGMFVSQLQIIDILEIYRLREVLDPLAIELCFLGSLPSLIEQMEQTLNAQMRAFQQNDYYTYILSDCSFHRAYVDACSNQKLRVYLNRLIDDSFRFSQYSRDSSERSTASIAYHTKILDAVKAEDVVSAKDAVRQHMIEIRNYYKSMV